MKKQFTFLVFLLISIGFINISARPHRVDQIPNGIKNGCANCHVNPAGGGVRNDFGKLVEARFLDVVSPSGNVQWGPALAHLDADGDGVSNGLELQDEFGLWQTGQANPGTSGLVTLPGVKSNNPLTTLKVNFAEMNPHLGQTLYLRVIDKSTMKEAGRIEEDNIQTSFDLELDVIIPGRNYYIDFFADANSNGLYDSPPTDHAWRMEINNASGNDILNFVHNTQFIDIGWKYSAAINFSSMNPHLGQLLEARAVDLATGKEAGRSRIEMISSSDFLLNVLGLDPGKDYNIEFYADLNGNALYNAPPTDHAWLETVSTNSGNAQLNFDHNASFTDISWNYLVTIDFIDMSPYLNQLFELRVVDQSNDSELGRTKFDPIPSEEFSVQISGIEGGKSYNIDFYADLNGNGTYDTPPTDHAWRISFTASSGNQYKNFAHNTEFTDIQWTDVTNIEDDNIAITKFKLFQNYPNPFNPETTIKFDLKENNFTSLKIFDLLGREVASLINEYMVNGSYELKFDAGDLPSGIYLYNLKSGGYVDSNKMILLK